MVRSDLLLGKTIKIHVLLELPSKRTPFLMLAGDDTGGYGPQEALPQALWLLLAPAGGGPRVGCPAARLLAQLPSCTPALMERSRLGQSGPTSQRSGSISRPPPCAQWAAKAHVRHSLELWQQQIDRVAFPSSTSAKTECSAPPHAQTIYLETEEGDPLSALGPQPMGPAHKSQTHGDNTMTCWEKFKSATGHSGSLELHCVSTDLAFWSSAWLGAGAHVRAPTRRRAVNMPATLFARRPTACGHRGQVHCSRKKLPPRQPPHPLNSQHASSISSST